MSENPTARQKRLSYIEGLKGYVALRLRFASEYAQASRVSRMRGMIPKTGSGRGLARLEPKS